MKRLLAFDLDGTLALSKQALEPDMQDVLKRLLDVAMVAVISGGDWPQFEKQVVSRLPAEARVERLFILPTTGTKLYRCQSGEWTRIYADLFSDEEREKIVSSLHAAAEQAGMVYDKTYGPQIEDRGSQITFSALGQEAPLEVKDPWDPDHKKRQALRTILQPMLPGLSINIGGASSVDITREGIDKAHGLRQLSEHSEIPIDDMLFLGDAIFPGGNDYPAKTMGMDTVRVRDPQETLSVLEGVIACLKP